MPYYIPNVVSKTTCLGNSLSTFNISFTALDTNLYNLSVYTPIQINYLSSVMIGVSGQLNTKINYLSSTMISVSGQLKTIVFNTSSYIMSEMQILSNYTVSANNNIQYVSSHAIEDYIQDGLLFSNFDGDTVNWDFNIKGTNATLSLGYSSILANPTSLSAGQTGNLIIQISTTPGKCITAYGSAWTFVNNNSALNTAANARNILSYYYDGIMLRSSMVNF